MGAYLSQPRTDKDSEDGGDLSSGVSRFGVSSMQGWRQTMEDAHLAKPDFADTAAVYGVFDGHGGHAVSNWVAKHLCDVLKEQLQSAPRNADQDPSAADAHPEDVRAVKAALARTFLTLDERMQKPESRRELKELHEEIKTKQAASSDDADDEAEEDSPLADASGGLPPLLRQLLGVGVPRGRGRGSRGRGNRGGGGGGPPSGPGGPGGPPGMGGRGGGGGGGGGGGFLIRFTDGQGRERIVPISMGELGGDDDDDDDDISDDVEIGMARTHQRGGGGSAQIEELDDVEHPDTTATQHSVPSGDEAAPPRIVEEPNEESMEDKGTGGAQPVDESTRQPVDESTRPPATPVFGTDAEPNETMAMETDEDPPEPAPSPAPAVPLPPPPSQDTGGPQTHPYAEHPDAAMPEIAAAAAAAISGAQSAKDDFDKTQSLHFGGQYRNMVPTDTHEQGEGAGEEGKPMGLGGEGAAEGEGDAAAPQATTTTTTGRKKAQPKKRVKAEGGEPAVAGSNKSPASSAGGSSPPRSPKRKINGRKKGNGEEGDEGEEGEEVGAEEDEDKIMDEGEGDAPEDGEEQTLAQGQGPEDAAAAADADDTDNITSAEQLAADINAKEAGGAGVSGMDMDEDEDSLMMSPFTPEGCGSTAVVAFVMGGGDTRRLIVANAGDSRCVLSRAGVAHAMSHDHKPDLPSETERIHAAGGSIMNGRVDGNLNLSRSLGDLHYKRDKDRPPQQQRITADPEISVMELSDEDEFAILACDGIWDCLTSQQAVDFVRQRLFQYEVTDGAAEPSLSKICEAMCDHCLAANAMQSEGIGCDNMTALILQLNPLSRILAHPPPPHDPNGRNNNNNNTATGGPPSGDASTTASEEPTAMDE
ncbi:unnamed protein product [Vitrella brassicaformis CCMP3155]|uniref:PPM-type phosphatase domain-containing protein n=2 Tax=Vitrella brassicaformis TaxID=1169539 RepID=A0A0G4GIE2_VITBC|nr:unnamed protein product [Vitrella brassicaformis CCMP3155]|eukprot:CEM29612.1 unnamed protein product [Vitrella brassicaformis CCMP3155]